MAGVQAGRLNIEIVAEIARLQQDLDRAKRAVGAASADIAKSARHANDNLAGMGTGLAKAGTQSRLASHHVQNLAFQFNDLFVGLASGQKPMTVFMQQGTQIGQIMGQAGIGVGGLVKQIGGMIAGFARAHPILVGISAAIGVAAAGFKLFSSQIDDTGEIDRFAKGLGLTKKEMEDLGSTSVTLGDAFTGLWRTINEALGLSDIFTAIKEWSIDAFTTVLGWGKNAAAGVYAAFVGTYEGIKAVWPMLPQVIGEAAVAAANIAIAAFEKLANLAIQAIRGIIPGLNSLLTAAKMVGVSFGDWEVDLPRLENQFAGAGAAASGAFANGWQKAYSDAQSGMDSFGQTLSDNIIQAAKDRLSAKAAELIDDRTAKAAGKTGGKKAGDEFAKELIKQVKAAMEYLAGLQDEIAKFGLPAEALRRLEVQAKAAAAPFKELADAILSAGSALEELRHAEVIRDLQANIDQTRKLTEARLAAYSAFQGDALAEELERINLEHEKSLILQKALIEAEKLRKAGMDDLATKALEVARKQVEILDTAAGGEKAERSIERMNDRLRDMIGLLDRIGGAGSVLGSLLAVVSGNFNSVASGPLGDLLAFALNTPTGVNGKKLGDELKASLEGLFTDTFGKDGLFGQTLTETLQAGGTGLASANAILGKQGAAGQVGSILGGIGGQIAGEALKGAATKAFGAAVGSVVPVVGTILGGIVGGLLGGLFGGSPKGSVSFTGSGVTGSTGKGDQLAAATKAANASIASLNQIATALGGSLQTVRGVSVGMKKDNWYLDPTGQGRTKGSGVQNFGQDGEAAAMAATKLLIERGVIKGIRASTQNILKAGTDLQAQLEKALQWESVFSDLKATVSPFAASLEELSAQFSTINDLARQAKASTEELAQVQELLIKKQEALVAQAMQSYRSTFNTDAENAAFAQKTIADTLGPLGYGNVTTVAQYKALVQATDALANPALFGALIDLTDEFGLLKDAADSAAQAAEAQRLEAAALAAQRGQMEVELLRLQGKETESLAKARALEIAALDPSLQALMRQIHAAQDLATAQDNLRTAYEREKSTLEDAADKFRTLGTSLRELLVDIYATDNGATGYAEKLARLQKVGSLALFGDQEAMGQLGGVVRDFLPAAKANARTLADFQRAQALAAKYTREAIGSADQGLSVAEQQLLSMKEQVGKLIDLNESVLSVADAIARLTALTAPPPATSPALPVNEREERADFRQKRLEERLDRMERANVTNALAANKLTRFFSGAERGGVLGVRLVADDTTP